MNAKLELGRCDLYLTCPKFVTTPQYIPRLNATERGWAREVERHRCTAERIRTLLAELNEPRHCIVPR